MLSSVLPVFSSKSFTVSGLAFKSLIHFEFIFVYGGRKCSNFILLQVAVQFSKEGLLISWLQSPFTVILELKKICHCFYFFPFYLPWSDETGCPDLSFLNAEFQVGFFTHSPSSRGCLVHLHFLKRYHLLIWCGWYFTLQSGLELMIALAWHFTWYSKYLS